MRTSSKLFIAVFSLATLAVAVGERSTQAAPVVSQKVADAAQKVFDDSVVRYRTGQGNIDEVILWSERIYDADHGASSFVARAKSLEAEAQAKVSSGIASKHDTLAAAYHSAEAESHK